MRTTNEKPIKHLVVDIETLGIKANAAVMSIAIVDMDGANDLILNLNVAEQLVKGCSIDHDTLSWWSSQPKGVLDQVLKTEPVTDVEEALAWLSSFIEDSSENHEIVLWSKGSNFDFPILENLFRTYNLPVPWMYRQIKDLRTLIYVSGFDEKTIPFEGTKHVAIDDALHEAKVLHECLKAVIPLSTTKPLTLKP